MQVSTQDIVKILPKGLITIPKKWRKDLGFEENGLARLQKKGKRLILEPVNIIAHSLRDYSKKEIRQFVKEDQISPKLAKKARKLLQ